MNFDLFDLPDGLLESLQANWGTGLTDDMVVQSMHDASEFFNITDPMQIVEGWTTGVYNNNRSVYIGGIVFYYLCNN